jgi:Rab3 GTPase-activating protein catalytic subunit
VHFTYVLRDFDLFCWPQLPPDFDKQDKKGAIAEISELPFGSTSDPVSELNLSTTWPSLAEDVVVDNSVYSDLDPMEAPRWTLRVRYGKHTCLMDECLTHFLKLSDYHQSIEEIIGHIPSNSSEPDSKLDIAGALQRLTYPHLPSGLSGVMNATTLAAFSEDESPFSSEMMDTIMKYLFQSGEDCESDLDPRTCEENSVPLYKTAPFHSLTHRLAIALCLANHNFGGIRAVAFLWREIGLELRYRWEHGHLLPSLGEGAPNLHYSLLHQKLQMLNHCIRQKQKHQATRCQHSKSKLQTAKTLDVSVSVAKENIDETDDNSDSSDNDEFFEAAESPDQLLELDSKQPTTEADNKQPVTEADNKQPVTEADGKQPVTESDGWEAEGILHQLGNEVLINNGCPLYIPQTQEPLVMTEDMVNELSEKLSQLGTSEKAAKMRARMQSAQLISDMQAFKAANPGCILADFVRWYSPRDWLADDSVCEKAEALPTDSNKDKTTSAENDWDIVYTDVPRDGNGGDPENSEIKDEPSGQAPFVKGHLSARMEQPGNFWQEVWEDVGPQPVRRQKRLFDDTVEAEKVLHMFSGFSVHELIFLLFPMILHHAVSKLQDLQGK